MSGVPPLLDLQAIRVTYPVRHKQEPVPAVDGVCLHVAAGETVGLVGESGSGKTTLGSVGSGILEPTDGRVLVEGKPLDYRDAARMQEHRQTVQMVFQDPFGSLNPRLTIGDALREVLWVYRATNHLATREARRNRVHTLLDQVGLRSGLDARYPHELSGGQRQRVGIARALAVGPRLLIADEPVSALDVSVQVQILNLLKDLSSSLGIACLLIAHDLAVVRYMASRVYVMHRGLMVEQGLTQDVFRKPQHHYTQQLLSAVPDVQRALAARQARLAPN